MAKKMTKKTSKGNLRELKTEKTLRREDMLSYLDFLRSAAEENRLASAIFITDIDDGIEFHAIGEINELEVLGFLDVARTYFQMELF